MNTQSIPYLFPSNESQSCSTGQIIWLFGLSGAGKSSIAQQAQDILKSYNKTCFILDGDDLRSGLNSDLGFSEQDRCENIRRAAETAILLSRTCDIVICTFITPKQEYRDLVKHTLKEHTHHAVCINTPLSECEKRDTKGLYKKARNGDVQHFTGISSPYDFPEESTTCIETINTSAQEAAWQLLLSVTPDLIK
jgi:adenylylsulfate kinase